MYHFQPQKTTTDIVGAALSHPSRRKRRGAPESGAPKERAGASAHGEPDQQDVPVLNRVVRPLEAKRPVSARGVP